jgi:hypothetical protein
MAKITGMAVKTALSVSILFGLSAGAAMAGTITTTSVSLPNGSTTINIVDNNASIDGGGNNIITGTIGLQTTAQGSLNTYCTDLFDYINLGNNSYTFNNSALTAGQGFATGGNGSSTSPWTQNQVNLINNLVANEALQSNSNSTINTAAMQVAIWEIEYGTAVNGLYGVTTNNGGFYFSSTGGTNSSATLSQAQTYLNDVTSGSWGSVSGVYVSYLVSNPAGTQNLIYLATGSVATPEPSTVAVFGLGLIGLWAARRRKMI